MSSAKVITITVAATPLKKRSRSDTEHVEDKANSNPCREILDTDEMRELADRIKKTIEVKKAVRAEAHRLHVSVTTIILSGAS